MPIDAGLIIAGGTALYKTISGGIQEHDAAADQAKNVRPPFVIPKEWYDNDNLAASMAQHGLTEPALNYYTTQAGRGLSSGLGAILQTGGTPSSVSDLYDTYDSNLNKIASEDAEMKNSNINNYIQANSNLGNEEEKKYALNDLQPYLDRSKANQMKQLAGQQNFYGGLTDLGNDALSYGIGQYKKSGASPATTNISPVNRNDNATNWSTIYKGFGANGGTNEFGLPNDINDTIQPAATNTLMNLFKANPNSPYLNNLQSLLGTTNSSNVG